MNEPERINYIIEHFEDGNAADFARKIGKSAPSVSKLRRGQYSFMSYADEIARAYPSLNCRWLLTGIGDPLAKEMSYRKTTEKLDSVIQSLEGAIARLERIDD